MSAPTWLDVRAVIAALAVALATAACGAAVDVRDRIATAEHNAVRIEQVQAERDRAILARLDEMAERLKDLQARTRR